jgi:hypothetical protein
MNEMKKLCILIFFFPFFSTSLYSQSLEVRKKICIDLVSCRESSYNSDTIVQKEDAVGYLGIRPIMVDEVNQIVGYKKYTLKDRLSKEKSIQMFLDYQDFVTPSYSYKDVCRNWNGGRKGKFKETTLIYWDLIKKDVIIEGILTYKRKVKNNPFYGTELQYLFDKGYENARKKHYIYHIIDGKSILIFDGKKIL